MFFSAISLWHSWSLTASVVVVVFMVPRIRNSLSLSILQGSMHSVLCFAEFYLKWIYMNLLYLSPVLATRLYFLNTLRLLIFPNFLLILLAMLRCATIAFAGAFVRLPASPHSASQSRNGTHKPTIHPSTLQSTAPNSITIQNTLQVWLYDK